VALEKQKIVCKILKCTTSLTLREGHKFRVTENSVLRTLFGPKRDEVAGGWRRLHNEELHVRFTKYY
jgi:hypothetical protein